MKTTGDRSERVSAGGRAGAIEGDSGIATEPRTNGMPAGGRADGPARRGSGPGGSRGGGGARRSNGRGGAPASRLRGTRDGGNGGLAVAEGQLELAREAVLRAVAERPQAGQSELAASIGEALSIAPSTAVKRLQALEREGAITAVRDGRRKRFVLPDANGASNGAGIAAAPAPAAPAGPGAPTAPGTTLQFPALRGPRRLLRIPRLRRPHIRPARAAAWLLVTVGVLLLAEGILTVVWKEPFTALKTARAQDSLSGDLDDQTAREEAALERLQDRRRMNRFIEERAAALNGSVPACDALGRIKIDKIDISFVVVQDTADTCLTKGPAHYDETPLPGAKGNWTVGIAGHRTTYDAPFRRLDELEKGDKIVLTMSYARFTYVMEGTKIVDAEDRTVFTPKGYDRLALTACHPLYSDAQRIIAYARLKKMEPVGQTRRATRS